MGIVDIASKSCGNIIFDGNFQPDENLNFFHKFLPNCTGIYE